MRLVVNGNGTANVRPSVVDLDREPCPTVMAEGLAGVCRRGGSTGSRAAARGRSTASRGTGRPRLTTRRHSGEGPRMGRANGI